MIKKNLVCGILFMALMAVTVTGCSTEEASFSGGHSINHSAESGNSQSNYSNYGENVCVDTVATCDECYDEGYYCNEYDYDYDDSYFNTEEYSSIKENSFSDTTISPLSTFAADVDTASYSNFRRFVNEGYTLDGFPSGAIRTEEMVNYFSYNYAEPEDGEVFGVHAQMSKCPWNDDAELLRIGINTATMDSKDVPDCNIVFLVDVSGSMDAYNKLDLIIESMDGVIEQFDKNDRISIVTYASGTQIVLDGCKGNKHDEIMNAFEGLTSGGATNGSAGIDLAYQVAEDNYIEGGVNRVIIMSDGDFNVGQTSQSELTDLITEKKDSGIFLSVLGFGMYNYSDTTMETLADCGNGSYAYIDTLAEANKVLVDEMTSTFVTVAKDVKFQIEFNPAVVAQYRLVGYENRTLAAEDFKDDTKDGGEMGAGHQVTAIYEIVLADSKGSSSALIYQQSVLTDEGLEGSEYGTLSIAYKDPSGTSSMYETYPISTSCYTDKPDEDFVFASMVAETSLAIRNSEYLKNASPDQAIEGITENLGSMRLNDEYKKEFLSLLESI